MSIFEIGQDIPLTTRLLKNNKPDTEQTVTVRVVDQKTGVEVLPSTSAPETIEPGVYTFLWTTPPQQERELLAIFDFGPRTVSEFFSIRDPSLIETQVANVVVREDEKFFVGVVQDQLVKVQLLDKEVFKVNVLPEPLVFVKLDQPIVNVLVICD